jgi:hypothetical protein
MTEAGEIQGMSTIGFGGKPCNLHKATSRCQDKVDKGKCPGGIMDLSIKENQQKNFRSQCVGRGPLVNIRV